MFHADLAPLTQFGSSNCCTNLLQLARVYEALEQSVCVILNLTVTSPCYVNILSGVTRSGMLTEIPPPRATLKRGLFKGTKIIPGYAPLSLYRIL